tara:strand:+ start:882 stop:1061 length:180 start_codon:yes stop_codon:yes gene_type:complete
MIKDSIEQIISGLQNAVADAEKCDGGNAAAGRRVRKAAQEARNALLELRKQVTETVKSN